jgi:hypothetical protein
MRAGNQKMSFEDNETNGRPGDDEDENGELEEETEDESEEHVSEEIVERERGGFRTSERETAETGEDDTFTEPRIEIWNLSYLFV